MQREILFRGLKADGSNEWVIGNLFVPNQLVKGVYICPSTTMADFAPDFEDGDDFEESKKSGCALGHFHEVIPETVGQFCGLTDKNGTRIFEVDRFKTPNGFIGVIKWGHRIYREKRNKYECHGWLYVNDSNNHTETLDSEILAGEVIGNIHQK